MNSVRNDAFILVGISVYSYFIKLFFFLFKRVCIKQYGERSESRIKIFRVEYLSWESIPNIMV